MRGQKHILTLLFTFSQAGKLLSFSFVKLFLHLSLDIVEKNKSDSTTDTH